MKMRYYFVVPIERKKDYIVVSYIKHKRLDKSNHAKNIHGKKCFYIRKNI